MLYFVYVKHCVCYYTIQLTLKLYTTVEPELKVTSLCIWCAPQWCTNLLSVLYKWRAPHVHIRCTSCNIKFSLHCTREKSSSLCKTNLCLSSGHYLFPEVLNVNSNMTLTISLLILQKTSSRENL